jgi:hypothetical protein
MTCWLGELATAPRVRLLDLVPVSRSLTRPGVSRTSDVPSSVEPLVGRVEWRHHDAQDRHSPRRPVPHPRRDQHGAARPHRHLLAAGLHPQPIAIAALMTQLLAVEDGRRPQIGGV